MKLIRNATTSIDQHIRDSAPHTPLKSGLCHGRVHHFTIENATAIELEAIENLLVAAGFKHDGCPIYDKGISCGWWIVIDESDDFRNAYNRAKRRVDAEVGRISLSVAKEMLNEALIAFDASGAIQPVQEAINTKLADATEITRLAMTFTARYRGNNLRDFGDILHDNIAYVNKLIANAPDESDDIGPAPQLPPDVHSSAEPTLVTVYRSLTDTRT